LVLVPVVLGLLFPAFAVVTRASSVILAVMIGSISLTLSVGQFRRIDVRTFSLVPVGHVVMPFVSYGIALVLELSPELTVGAPSVSRVNPLSAGSD
jgi:BASS family bile acid:Na+ symporter